MQAVNRAGTGRMIAIADADDPRIAFFRDIRERDLARRSHFVAEGAVVVNGLLDSPFYRAQSLLILANRVSGLAALLAKVPAETPVYVAERVVMDAIAGFPMHRGVLAAGARRDDPGGPSIDALLARSAASNGVIVVAVGIANHDNMGAIFRNACAFGVDAVLLDATSCDPLYRKSIRVSAGAVLQVPFARVDADALATLLGTTGFRCFALSPKGRAGLGALEGKETAAALFLGTEGRGLPEKLMAAMEAVRIDMAPGFDSLNVATAAAIALQRLYSVRAAPAG